LGQELAESAAQTDCASAKNKSDAVPTATQRPAEARIALPRPATHAPAIEIPAIKEFQVA
jgi:hypothetical protein